MANRPAALAAAVVLMLIIGSGAAFVGALLLVVAAGGVAFLGPASGVSGVVGLLGVVALLTAAATLATAIGLWLRRPWGWAGSLAIAIVAVLGAIIALDTSGSQPPLLAGFVLTLAATALLLVPGTRRATGIG